MLVSIPQVLSLVATWRISEMSVYLLRVGRMKGRLLGDAKLLVSTVTTDKYFDRALSMHIKLDSLLWATSPTFPSRPIHFALIISF